MTRRVWSAVVAVASAVTVSSCASISVDALPQPGESYRAGYDLIIEFDNVLNLPDRAKVVMGGTQVGIVTEVAIGQDQVDVTVQIDPSVAVPSDVHATLEQATVLGDIYVTLDRPLDQAAAPALTKGATIPRTQTTSPPQVEDTITHLANFVTSGSIQRIQNTIIRLNRVTPPPSEVRALASQVAVDLSDLSNNIDTVDHLLNGVSETARVLNDSRPSIDYIFAPRGMTGIDRATQTAAYLARLFPGVGSIYAGGYWLVPLLNSLKDATGAMQYSKWAFEDEWPAWRRMFTDTFLPQDKFPAINITSIVGPDGREMSGNAADVLRILGAIP
jgi:phospholipid/cholesterol/gamma-HCH transport system substrate-binding protein